MRRLVLRFAALAAVAVATAVGVAGAAGCSADDPPEPTPQPPRPRQNQINPRPPGELVDGGRLSWPMSTFPANFNYFQVDGASRATAEILDAILPRTHRVDDMGQPYPDPDLLAAPPTVTTQPTQVVTYKIKPTAIWYHESPVTWEDFLWQWRAASGANPAYAIASPDGYDRITNITRGADDREVVVTFRDRYADWTALFSPLLPASLTRDPGQFNEGWRSRPASAGGPFRVASVDRRAGTVTLLRNERWWGRRARLESITFRVVEPAAQIAAMATGELDLADIGPDAALWQRAKTLSDVDIRLAAGPQFRQLVLNGDTPALRDVRVRRAIAMGIDRAAIGTAILGPLGIEAKPLDNHLFTSGQAGYRNNSGEAGRHDPVRADALLDESGWTRSGQVRQRDGQPLHLALVIPAGVRTAQLEADLIIGMLARIGVGVSVTVVPASQLFDGHLVPGRFDLALFTWIGTPYPVSSARSGYANPVRDAAGQLAMRRNYARVGSPELDLLFDRADTELDWAKAAELANEIDARIWAGVPSLPLYQRPDQWAVRDGLANLGAFGFASPIYQDIGWIKS